MDFEHILAIDPGPKESGFIHMTQALGEFVFFSCGIVDRGIWKNDKLREVIADIPTFSNRDPEEWLIAIEDVRSYGMAVGKDVFQTVRQIGRFEQVCAQAGMAYVLVPRTCVKMTLCHNTRAKDTNIRQALLDHYGDGSRSVVGTKGRPGPLYGIKRHMWAALALATTIVQLNESEPEKLEALRRENTE